MRYNESRMVVSKLNDHIIMSGLSYENLKSLIEAKLSARCFKLNRKGITKQKENDYFEKMLTKRKIDTAEMEKMLDFNKWLIAENLEEMFTAFSYKLEFQAAIRHTKSDPEDVEEMINKVLYLLGISFKENKEALRFVIQVLSKKIILSKALKDLDWEYDQIKHNVSKKYNLNSAEVEEGIEKVIKEELKPDNFLGIPKDITVNEFFTVIEKHILNY